MSEDELRLGYGELWHWAIPQLNSMAFADQLAQNKLGITRFTDEQARTLAVIANIARRIRENWSYVFDVFVSPQGRSHENVLSLCATWWNYEAKFLEKATVAIDSLLAGGLGELILPDSDREALKIIRQGCHLAADDWEHGKNYLLALCGFQSEWKWQSVSLQKVVSQAIDYLKACYGIDSVDVTMPRDLPLVKGNYWLERALINIVNCVDSHTLHGYLFKDRYVSYRINHDYRPAAMIELENGNAVVHVTVGLVPQKECEDSPLDSRLFSLGTRLSVVGFILERYDTQAQVRWSDQSSEFRFTVTSSS